MSIPGFTAHHTLGKNTSAYRAGPAIPRGSRELVRPASCFGDCFQECVADGGMSKPGCRTICAQECGGVPPDNPPYVCKPTDNSVNHTLCIGALEAWKFAASADCKVVLGGVPVVGPALVAACIAGVEGVVAQTGCPPAVICV